MAKRTTTKAASKINLRAAVKALGIPVVSVVCVAGTTGDLWDCACPECVRLQREANDQARHDGCED